MLEGDAVDRKARGSIAWNSHPLSAEWLSLFPQEPDRQRKITRAAKAFEADADQRRLKSQDLTK
jgi:hypothetical protein